MQKKALVYNHFKHRLGWFRHEIDRFKKMQSHQYKKFLEHEKEIFEKDQAKDPEASHLYDRFDESDDKKSNLRILQSDQNTSSNKPGNMAGETVDSFVD